MTDQQETIKKQHRGVPIWALVVIAIVAAGITFLITIMVGNIGEHKGEANSTFTQVVTLTDTTYDPAVWGQNFPREYDGYLATANFTPTAHDQALVPHQTVPAVGTTWDDTVGFGDDRTQTTPSKLDEDPRLVTLWKGYAFSIDYRHLRGHEWMLKDQQTTLRVLAPRAQPGACLNCHTSLPEVLNQINPNDTMAAWADMNKMTYGQATSLSKGPVACIDCHDPETMDLRISRPAFINGIAALKASQGIANYDVNRDATTQEMRSYVCAQCHVEYYMPGDAKTLTFPWNEGTDLDDVWNYYQEIGFSDFTHAITGAKLLKAQHPEFESWSAGVHAANGVTCADCHMNYQRDGSQKISNHDVTSPMENINGTCGVCHTASDQVIQDRVTQIQNRFVESRDRAMDAVTQLINQIGTATTDGTPQAQIDLAVSYQAKANFYIDYAYSENSYGFHAPDYFQRIINESLDASRNGQLALLGVPADQLAPTEVAQKNLEGIQDSGLK